MTCKSTALGLLWSSVGFLGIWGAYGTTVSGATGSPAELTAEPLLARRILDDTGVRGGLIVHLGCGAGKLTAALRAGDCYVVHGLDAGGEHVESARRYVRSRGLYGKVSIEAWSGNRLPYIENLVNLIVVEDPAAVPQAELLRVLVPEGVAYLKAGGGWKKLVKPRPPEIDQWTHYLHDPSNNAVAHDALVGPPRHLQWVSGPAWSRHHDHMASMSALVSAGGRIFYIMDEGPREAILLPSQWSLIARDAFNGTVLWKRPIAEWNTQLWPLKSGPNQLPRRLVAVGDRVYVTLGIDAPLVALDAATGRTVRTYAGTDHTDEVLDAEGTLFLLVGAGPNRWKQYRPTSTYVWDNTRYANKQWAWDKVERSVVAIQAATGAVLWRQQRRVAPLTLTADRERVLFYDGEKVVCLDRRTGAPLWTSQPILRKLPFPTGYGPTLVIQQGVALLSVESRSMTALDAADGKTLWTAEHHPGGHASPDDLLVINGLVWSGDVANAQNSGVFTGRDLHTGAVKSEFPPDVSPDWFHHRCYRSRATDRFFIASRTGFEFIDLDSKHWDFNHWVRGGCLYGFMPANGLLYAPPHDCGCFLESKLFGFNALAAESPGRAVPREVPDAGRLERGPAYPDPWPGPAAGASDEWPSYRHDPQRSGSVKTAVPAELRRLWQADLGGRLSSVVVAEGKLFVSAVDAFTLYALDAGSGATAWTYTLGGPVDSPPTIYRGRVLFGSSDGWIYCLRAADGRLAWRFRAAPLDRRLMAYDRLESAWPVSGSVLVVHDALYAVAGRSAFLDGGMRLLRLDPRTGRKLSETLIDDRDPATGKNLQSKIKGQDMPVALPDILSCDGRSIYMRTQAFDFEGQPHDVAPLKLVVQRQQQLQQLRRRRGEAPEKTAGKTAAKTAERTDLGDHLFSRSGFLDDSWFFRSYWMYGKAVDGNYGGWLIPGHYAPCGRLIVFDDACAYGFDRKPEYLCNAAVQEYYLYGADRAVTPESIDRVQKAARRINRASPKSGATSSDWATRKKFPLSAQSAVTFHWAEGNPPIQARALVLAGGTLFVAGPPDVVDEEEAFRNLDDPAIQAKLAEQAAALHGGLGGELLAISAADGRKLAAYEIGAMPTFDGMAAAGGRLYLSTIDGKVLCLAGQGDPLPAAPEVKLVSLDTAVKPLSTEPGPPNGPSRAGDFAQVVRAEVGTSPLGYHLVAEGQTPGWAVKRLPAPLTGKMVLKLRMRVTGDGELRNGFLVFGDSPQEPRLVKCGLRYAQERAMIVEGSLAGGRVTAQPCPAEEGVIYGLEVTFDPSSGRVTLKTGQVTVTAKLAKPPAEVSYVGFAAIDAAADFSAAEVSAAK